MAFRPPSLTPFVRFPGCRNLWPGTAAGALHSLHRGPQPGIAPHLHTPKPSHLILLLPDPLLDPQEALRTRGFLELSAPALLPLLRSDKLCVDEAELVLAARSWARVGAVSWGYGGPRGGDAEGGLGRRNLASGWRGRYPARPGLGLAFAGRAGAARGRGGGPGGAGAETGLTGPGGAERPGRAEPAGAAHPGADAGNQTQIHSAAGGGGGGWGWRGSAGVGGYGPGSAGRRGVLPDFAVTGLPCR